MSILDRDRLHRSRTSSKILVLMVLSFLSIALAITVVFPPFDRIQVVLAATQQENNKVTTPSASSLIIVTRLSTGKVMLILVEERSDLL
jgi:flagellar biosynthesis protein FliP